jgi:predicted flap endonuclease-1-like 5' DNA nuclease
MFKTKGFSSNNSLKRRAIIVDAPDLPPEECEFFITSAGVADTEKAEVSKTRSVDFEVETLFEEESGEVNDKVSDISLMSVKGIGAGTAESLEEYGITTIENLLKSNPDEIASKISGVSSKKVVEWQTSAKALIKI